MLMSCGLLPCNEKRQLIKFLAGWPRNIRKISHYIRKCTKSKATKTAATTYTQYRADNGSHTLLFQERWIMLYICYNYVITHNKWHKQQTWRGSFSSVEPSISFTKSWRSSGPPKVKHFSTTLEANFCWLIWTICPANFLIMADRSWGFPCSNTCCYNSSNMEVRRSIIVLGSGDAVEYKFQKFLHVFNNWKQV